jgi:Tol biopolymer transport system component
VMEEAVPMIVPEVREAEVKPVAAPMEEAVPFWRRVPLWAWGAVGGVVLLLVVGGVWLAIVEGLLWTGGGPKDRPTLPDGWVYSSNLGGNWEIYIMEGGQPHQLTDYPAYDCCPSWSPDGSQIAFYRWDRDTDGNGLITTADHEELWVMNADGSNPIQVSADGGDKRGCWWSPDSRKLAFRTNGARDVNGDGKVDYEDDEVYVVGADGSGLVAVIDGMAADTDFVAWAPDSQWLIIMSQRDTNDDGQIDYMDDDAIYSVGSDGSGLTQLSKPGGDAYVTSVSPDGTRLAFWASHYRDSNGDSQIDYEDTMELYVMDLDGSGLIALTEDNLDDWDPEWSPDGRKIAFRKEDGGEDIYNLYTVTPDGLGTVRLTDDRSYKYGHTWAPDGSKIVFTACPEDTDGDGDLGWGDKEAVWLVSAQGGPIVELTDLHGEASYTWAPDSQHLAIRTRDQDANGDGRVDSDDPEQLFIVSADGRQSSGPLLGEGDLSCRWSEDGSTLYFVYRSQDTNGDGRLGVDDEGEIYTISADGTKLTRLSDREAGYRGFYQPTPTPSPVTYGGRIAFLSGRDDNAEIYVMNADGSGQTRLTNNPAIDQNPAWSPDGTRIAFISLSDGNMEIYVMNADGSGVTRLTDNPDFDRSPSWSPDGRRIAFMSLRDGNGEIYVMNTDGSGQTNLTNNPDWDGVPSWSPYGTRIAFTSNRDGNYEIYVMNADGSGVTRLTDNPAVDASPAWSPDGRRIAFMSDRDGDREIHVMNADGSGQTNLTNNPADDSDPSWSPDGTCIVFTRMEEDTNGDGKINSLDAGEIYVINADGSGQTNLTNNPANDDCPAWGP